MKNKIKKLVAALAIAVVLVYNVLPMINVKAVIKTGMITITYKNNDSTGGRVEYSVDGGTTWIARTENTYGLSIVTSTEPLQNNLRIRIVPDEGYSVNLNEITYNEYYAGDDETQWGNHEYPLSEQANAPIAGALQSSQGYMVGDDYNSVGVTNVTFTSNNPPQPSTTHNVNFGSATWTVGQTEVTASIDNMEIGTNTPIEISDDAVITLTNFDSGAMDVKVESESGWFTYLRPANDGTVRLTDVDENVFLPNEDLIFSVIEHQNGGEALTFNVNFGSATWTIGEATVTASIENKTINTNDYVTINDNEIIQLSNNFDSSTMDVKIESESGWSTILRPANDKSVRLTDVDENVNIPNENLIFSVIEHQNGEEPQGGDENIAFDIKFIDTYVNIRINNVVVIEDSNGNRKNEFTGTIDQAGTTNPSETNVIKIQT